MKSDFLVALTQLAAERNLPREIVLSAIEAALASAYRKDSIAAGQDISVKLDPGSGQVSVYAIKIAVEEVTDEQLEIQLEDARRLRPEAEIGDNIPTDSLPHTAGRIAAQTAKQVVMQRLREAEREVVYEEFADREGEVFSVNVQRIEPKQVIVDLGRGEAVLPVSEQSPAERYRPGLKMKVLLQKVERSAKGPELIVSRADKELLKRLFEMEVPEIYNGAVDIVAIAREPGARSKVAVRARQDGVDPVGSCVGLRGVRIQNIVNELMGEKIDVVEWSKDSARFIANALNPAQVMRTELDPETQTAAAIVPERHLSLAIGKEGQNARLAARLTGWNIDIKSYVEAETVVAGKKEAEAADRAPTEVAVADKQIEETAEAAIEAVEPQAVEAEVDASTAEPTPEPIMAEEEAPVLEEATEETGEELEKADEEAPVDEPPSEQVPKPTEAPVEEPVLGVLGLEEQKQEEMEPALAVVDRSTSLRDVSDDVWSIRRSHAAEPGVIRFAEDIAGLKGGVTARRNQVRDRPRGRKRRKASRRR